MATAKPRSRTSHFVMVLNRVLLLLLISNINRVRPDLATAAHLGSAITHLGRVRHDLPFPIIGGRPPPTAAHAARDISGMPDRDKLFGHSEKNLPKFRRNLVGASTPRSMQSYKFWLFSQCLDVLGRNRLIRNKSDLAPTSPDDRVDRFPSLCNITPRRCGGGPEPG